MQFDMAWWNVGNDDDTRAYVSRGDDMWWFDMNGGEVSESSLHPVSKPGTVADYAKSAHLTPFSEICERPLDRKVLQLCLSTWKIALSDF